MSDYEFLLCRQVNGVAVITFNRPAKLNAMNHVLMTELIDAVEWAASEETVHVAVLTGSGKAFMAGADLLEYSTQTEAQFRAFQMLGRSLYATIEQAPKPFVAALNGPAMGGGFEIALSCDLIVARSGATCGLPEVLLGLVPGGGGTQRLLRRLGGGRAAELLMTGRCPLVDEWETWGVIQRVFSEETWEGEVLAYAHGIAGQERHALAAAKALLRLASGGTDTAAHHVELELLTSLYNGDPAKAKINAFFEERMFRKKESP